MHKATTRTPQELEALLHELITAEISNIRNNGAELISERTRSRRTAGATVHVEVGLSHVQYHVLETVSKKAGISRSELIRQILAKTIPADISEAPAHVKLSSWTIPSERIVM